MSFLKIKDPLKREQTVKEFLALKKRIHDNQLTEKTGDIELQTDLSKFFKPLTKSQKEIQEAATRNIAAHQLEAARRITEGLTPIREGVQQLSRRITEGLTPIREGIIQLPGVLSKELKPTLLPVAELPSYQDVELEKNKEEIKHFIEVFNEKHAERKYDFDNIYRIVFDKNSSVFKFGNKEIFLDPKDKGFFYFEEQRIPASDGLWELILSNDPKKYSKEELNIYQNLVYLSDIIFIDNDIKNDLKMYNTYGNKWNNIIKPVLNHINKKRTGEGLRKNKTTTVIPSDPNALLERFDLLMASKGAGHTGVKNELVSICDELKRQHVLNTKTYKKLMTIL